MATAAPQRRRIVPQQIVASPQRDPSGKRVSDPNDHAPPLRDLRLVAADSKELLGPGRKMYVNLKSEDGNEVIVNWKEVRWC